MALVIKRAFIALKSWPYSYTEAEIARQTPRQTFDMVEALRVAAMPATDGDAPLPEASEHQQIDPELTGLQSIGGLGLEKYDVFKPVPGERNDNPYSVPMEVARERYFLLCCTWADHGMIEHMGVPKENMEAARNFFEWTWRKAQERLQRLTAALLHRVEGDYAAVEDLCRKGELKTYGIRKMDLKIARAFFDHLWRLNEPMFLQMREKTHAVREVNRQDSPA